MSTQEAYDTAGGPAFSVPDSCEHGGMTLRDYFASHAMMGLVERWSPSAITSSDEIAKFAYGLADAMLKARVVALHDEASK